MVPDNGYPISKICHLTSSVGPAFIPFPAGAVDGATGTAALFSTAAPLMICDAPPVAVVVSSASCLTIVVKSWTCAANVFTASCNSLFPPSCCMRHAMLLVLVPAVRDRTPRCRRSDRETTTRWLRLSVGPSAAGGGRKAPHNPQASKTEQQLSHLLLVKVAVAFIRTLVVLDFAQVLAILSTNECLGEFQRPNLCKFCWEAAQDGLFPLWWDVCSVSPRGVIPPGTSPALQFTR